MDNIDEKEDIELIVKIVKQSLYETDIGYEKFEYIQKYVTRYNEVITKFMDDDSEINSIEQSREIKILLSPIHEIMNNKSILKDGTHEAVNLILNNLKTHGGLENDYSQNSMSDAKRRAFTNGSKPPKLFNDYNQYGFAKTLIIILVTIALGIGLAFILFKLK